MTLLSDVGEFGLHAWLAANFGARRGSLCGPGDDAAIIEVPDGYDVAVSTDRASVGNLADQSPGYVGRFTVTQNFSDIICKGARPHGFLLAALLERDTKLEYFESLVTSAAMEAKAYGARLVGGDTKENEVNTIVGVGIGLVRRGQAVARDGAKPGDVVAVSLTKKRRLGWRWARHVVDQLGYQGLSDAIVDAMRMRYEADLSLPLDETLAAVATGATTACIDLSDGLGDSLQMVGESSKVAFVIDEEAVEGLVDTELEPVAKRFGVPLMKFAWSPGFDWENLFTVRKEHFEDVRRSVQSTGGDLVPIGTVENDTSLPARIRVRHGRGGCSTLIPFSGGMFKKTRRSEQAQLWISHVDYVE